MNGRRMSLEASSDDSAVKADGLLIRTLSLSSGTIASNRELRDVIALGNPDSTITTILRRDLDPDYLQDIASDAEENGKGRKTMYTHWNQAGGMSPINAMPHIHDGINVHVAPTPSAQPTAFFSREAVREAVRHASMDLKHPINVRRQLQNALDYEDRRGTDHDRLYQALHGIDAPREGQLPLLECIQDIQRDTLAMQGIIEIPLSKDASGMVVIPRKCVHARSLLQELFRTDSQTAWRYFRAR